MSRRALATLSLSVACDSEPAGPWWERGAQACPEGTTLQGAPKPADVPITAPPGDPIPVERLQRYLEAWQVSCVSDDGDISAPRQGPLTTWYGNGRMASDGLWREGELVRGTTWDELGRQTLDLRCDDLRGAAAAGAPAGVGGGSCSGTATYWHADGVKALEGGMVDRHKHGVWSEWDEQGELIGRVSFEAGLPGEMSVSTSRFLVQASFLDGDVLLPPPPAGLELPASSTVGTPSLAVNLVLSQAALSVDGVRVLELVPSPAGDMAPAPVTIPAEHKRGALVTPLYDRLVEKRRDQLQLAELTGGEVDDALLVQADRDLELQVLHDVLYTAHQAQFARFLLVVQHPGFQLPPRSGPQRLRGQQLHQVHEVALAPSQRPELSAVLIDAQGFVVARPGLPDQVVPCLAQGCPGHDSYDGGGLAAAVAAVAEKQPAPEGWVILGDGGAPYQVLVKALDVVAEQGVAAAGQGGKLYVRLSLGEE